MVALGAEPPAFGVDHDRGAPPPASSPPRVGGPALARRCAPALASPGMEQSGNTPVVLGPRYAVRLRDLRAWHLVRVRCAGCGHEGTVGRGMLLDRFPDWTRLIDLEPRFRCRRCGQRGDGRFSVRVARRD
jgi:ribosomal protein L37E